MEPNPRHVYAWSTMRIRGVSSVSRSDYKNETRRRAPGHPTPEISPPGGTVPNSPYVDEKIKRDETANVVLTHVSRSTATQNRVRTELRVKKKRKNMNVWVDDRFIVLCRGHGENSGLSLTDLDKESGC